MSVCSTELNLATLPKARLKSSFLEHFDALAPREGLLINSQTDPRPILSALQAMRTHAFDWNVLERGPDRFRVEVVRRQSAIPPSIGEYLEADHKRLDAMLGEVEWHASRWSWAKARERFAELHCGLERHLEMEESVIFPAYESITGVGTGPTEVMRQEHRLIQSAMARLRGELEKGDPARVQNAVSDFEKAVRVHGRNEEHIVYPAIDRALRSEGEVTALIHRMQEI